MSFPSKAEREKCWATRDDLWKCLDDNNGSQEVCAKFRKIYESTCPSQWVKHFDRKREYLKFKDRIQKEGIKNSCNIVAAAAAAEEEGVDGGRRLIGLNIEAIDPSVTTAMTLMRRRAQQEVVVGAAEEAAPAAGITLVEFSNEVVTGDNNFSSSRSRLHVVDNNPANNSSNGTKIPSPRIFRKFQPFQPTTYS